MLPNYRHIQIVDFRDRNFNRANIDFAAKSNEFAVNISPLIFNVFVVIF